MLEVERFEGFKNCETNKPIIPIIRNTPTRSRQLLVVETCKLIQPRGCMLQNLVR